MNIGIDARGLWKKKSGIGIYIEQIIKKLNETDKDNNYILYSTKEIVLDFKLNNNFIVKENIKGKGSLWFYFNSPKVLNKDNIDVFWGTQHLLPMRNKYAKNIKFVLTIHDLAIKKLGTVGSLKNTIIQKIFLKKSIKNADKIIAISEATKKDIIEFFKIDNEKIQVVYNGTSISNHNYYPNAEQEKEIQQKFQIKDTPYLFFLSTIEPRKNVDTLIKAFEYVRDKNIDLKLILAGGLGWKFDSILKLIEDSKYKKDIIRPGYITNDEKEYLYKNAVCFVYPSLYEGFGLPILEAMSNETIVITANNSSLPEVGGTAAYYYEDTLNYENLGNKIIEIYNISKQEKDIKIKQGVEQTKKFTWEKCAGETLKILKKA